jgi:peptide/nickel transport system substrate-binding protein
MTPAYTTRTHGYLVFDTLFGMDNSVRAQPQMVEAVSSDADGKRWTLPLRPGLKFHDGEPVLARDCVASIRRWGQRNSYGQTLMARTDDLAAADDRTIVFQLKKPFPLLPEALGTLTTPMPAIMPERLAKTDDFTKVIEIVGSGPYRFKADEQVSGAHLAYERFAGYRPRESGAPERTSGPKIAYFDRVEWSVITDHATSAAALQTGEQDWWDLADPDLLTLLRRQRKIRLTNREPLGHVGYLRLNHLQRPFDNAAIRRALISAVSQEDFAIAIVGPDPSLWRTGIGFFPPDSPMASSAGMEALTGPRDLNRVRREIAAAGYKGERVVMPCTSDYPENFRRANVAVDMMQKVGMNAEIHTFDWATLLQRAQKKAPVDQGGWSCTSFVGAGIDFIDPAVNPNLRGNGTNSPRPGWPTSPRIEELRDAWLDASDLATRKRIATEIQLQAFQDVPYIPLCLIYYFTAYRNDLAGVLPGFSVFWNVRRQA